MKITEVRLGLISVPLRVPFKTALRSVSSVEDVIVEIHTDTGAVGYGEAPPTGVITGDTTGAIIGAIRDHIAKTIIGRDVDDFEDLMIALNACIQKNTSAKAAVDMALWDLYGQLYKIPVYKLMGGAKKSIVTDITISVNDPEEMVRDALNAKGGKYANFPMWYPDLCGKAHDPEEVSMQDLKDLGVYKLTGIHFSCHAAMLAMLDVGRHVLMEQSNDYVDYHFDDTGYKTFTTMSMFGLTDGSWVEAENAFVREPQDSIAQRNADYFVREEDVHNPDKQS